VQGNYTVTEFKVDPPKDQAIPMIPASGAKARVAWTFRGVPLLTFWFEVKITH